MTPNLGPETRDPPEPPMGNLEAPRGGDVLRPPPRLSEHLNEGGTPKHQPCMSCGVIELKLLGVYGYPDAPIRDPHHRGPCVSA